jgi:hypothetical protein
MVIVGDEQITGLYRVEIEGGCRGGADPGDRLTCDVLNGIARRELRFAGDVRGRGGYQRIVFR